ncbi:hypothetical protein [Mycolicibacterium llatzerense]|uniref:Diacylglycerol O-acyltransferase n=1 Tax=Mycolicibacterium llatzerense TaxID=280871 RepID=A0A0D1L8U4_9MYCO|nr:hypothetical protein [Mycolicibacterium llatzerense]KIU14667.1 hypothetical protein TL10_23205 [Mycolicibacterium llatzerense]MCT7369692.1 hypothetical protein [Mycolicibacterium llatzerense]
MKDPADSTLAYMDQASYLARRALGRGPVIQYVWIYERGVDLDGLRRFQRNLADGLLGRRVERSSVPLGRHHWVSSPPTGIDIATTERARDAMWEFADERADIEVDPEHGPPWHLGVQPLVGGGSIVSLVVSHTVADAGALIESITHAVAGTGRDLRYPAARSRTRKQALGQDLRILARAIAEIPAAVVGAAQLARAESADLAASAKAAPVSLGVRSERPVHLPTVAARVGQGEWDDRARALGGSSNVLLAGIASRIGAHIGRVDADGKVLLSIPVSERVEGDTRGNALNAITVTVDPEYVAADLNGLRGDVKVAFAEMTAKRDLLMAPLPLTPYTPKFLVRRLEKMVMRIGKPIGSSNVGVLPEAVNCPDGTPADYFMSRSPEPGVTGSDLDRMDGRLMLAAGTMAGAVWISVASWEVGSENTRDQLMQAVKEAFCDFDLAVELT